MNFKKNYSKTAVIGIDVEDWYHLDYLTSKEKNNDLSMLDGFDVIMDILKKNNCLSSLFVVGEIVEHMKKKLLIAGEKGHEIGSHGFSHKRPLLMTDDEFVNEIEYTKEILEKNVTQKVYGFRAPCFSLDRNKLNLLFKKNYHYDSSKIDFKLHKLYGQLNIDDFDKYSKNIYLSKNDKKVEFELPTIKFLNQTIPFSGGGYIRLFPFYILKKFVIQKEKTDEPIFMYLHPFEFSRKKININKISKKNYFRMNIGRGSLPKKFNKLINFMSKRGWKFRRFKDIYEEVI